MKTRTIIVALSAIGLAGAIPALAHHSFAAEYDSNKPITIKGTVVKMEFVNPHSWLHVSVKNDDGKTVEWNCETAPPNMLYRNGWRQNSIKQGDEVTVEGFQAKDNSATMNARSVTMPDGKRMFVGTAGDNGPDANKK